MFVASLCFWLFYVVNRVFVLSCFWLLLFFVVCVMCSCVCVVACSFLYSCKTPRHGKTAFFIYMCFFFPGRGVVVLVLYWFLRLALSVVFVVCVFIQCC